MQLVRLSTGSIVGAFGHVQVSRTAKIASATFGRTGFSEVRVDTTCTTRKTRAVAQCELHSDESCPASGCPNAELKETRRITEHLAAAACFGEVNGLKLAERNRSAD